MYHKTKMYGIHCKEEALRFEIRQQMGWYHIRKAM